VRDTVRQVSRQEPTRCSRRRSRDRSPLTTRAHPERTQPLAPLGEPHRARWRWLRSSRRRAQTLRNRSSATSDTRPWRSTSVSNRRPARPFGGSPTAADTSGPSGPRSQVNGVATESPRPGSEEPMAAPCVATGDADHGIAPHHRAYPQDGPLSEHGRSRDPPACTPRAYASLTGHIRRRSSARRLVKPISSESSEPAVPTLPPTRTAPRIHASSPSPNHAVDWFWSRRIGASSDLEVVDTNRSSRSLSKRSHV
jgi:hypothetical protein